MPAKLLVWFAELLSAARPLTIYPAWHFGIGDERQDLKVQARLALWRRFQESRICRRIRFRWVKGLELSLNLGDDISRCLYVDGAIEPNELAVLCRVLTPGMTFLDIGANEGLFSLLAARCVGRNGRVLAFEPSQRELATLRFNIATNKLTNIDVIDAAVADFRGTAVLRIANAEHAGHNTFGDFVWNGVSLLKDEEVQVTTIDAVMGQLTDHRVDIIKIDIEGAELRALQGGEKTLNESRPLIIMELSERSLRAQNTTSADVLQWLAEHRYTVFIFDEETGIPRRVRPDDTLSPNIVAMHYDRPFEKLMNV